MGRNQTEHSIVLPPVQLGEELERLREALATLETGDRLLRACSGMPPEEEMLTIVRFLPGISHFQWQQLADRYGLGTWLPLHLAPGACSGLEAVQQALDTMAMQRDTDPLTGLANRRAFDHQIEAELERARRGRGEVSLIMLDIDNFKAINDAFGHPCGDEVLLRLATLLQTSVRLYDFTARIGGEEFALILPCTSSVRAQSLCERILQRFASIAMECPGASPFHVSFSAGIATCTAGSAITRATIIEWADKALYEAKQAGRNRIHVHRVPGAAENDHQTLVLSSEKQFLFSGNA